jgi:Zn-dependent protease
VRRFRVRVGRFLGIPLSVHASWFLVFGLAVWAVTGQFGDALPQLPVGERLAMAAFTGMAFFACLSVHEIAHAVVARRFGVHVRGITLFLLGGVAEIEGELPSPGSEFAVALAGPGTSLAMGSLFALLSSWLHGMGWTGAEAVAVTLAAVNLGVAVFNLIPGLPLDGGRILRAGIWRRTGSFERATSIAARGGSIVAVSLVAFGAVFALTGQLAGLWYVPMGVFIWFLARASRRAAAPDPGRALALAREGEAA